MAIFELQHSEPIEESESSGQSSRTHSPFSEIFSTFIKANPFLSWGNKTERKAVDQLITVLGATRAVEMAKLSVLIQGAEFAPTITKPTELIRKYANLVAYEKRKQAEGKNSVAII
jgi:hypothetical protein